MSKKDDALKLALEALEDARTFTGAWPAGAKAITAIRAALAEQPAQDDPDLQDKDPELIEQPALECENCKALEEKLYEQAMQPAQQQYQSTADKCELTPVPAKGGLLPAQIDPETRTKDGLKYSPNYVAGYNNGLKAAQQHIEHCIWARNGNAPCPHVQPAQQESEAVRAAWMAGYTEGEREAIEKEQPANVAAVNTSSERVDKTEENVHEKNI